MQTTHLSTLQKDVLKEIGNIGVGNATTSLSTLLDQRVQMEVPSVRIVSFNEMIDLVGGPDHTVVALYFRIAGDAPGTVYFLLTVEEAVTLVQQISPGMEFDLTNEDGTHEYAQSVLQEVGNIITGSYLTALSDFLSLDMTYSIPYLSVDMVGALITVGLVQISEETDHAIIINTTIRDDENNQFQGQFILLPDPTSFPIFFTALGIQDIDE